MVKQFFLILVLSVLCHVVVSAEVNLALNKKYTMSPKPNYKLCTDNFDNVQLTDGKTYGSDWFSKSTVGWSNINEPVTIQIDLENQNFVEELIFHSIGGGIANVEYPLFIAAFGSTDGTSYFSMGLLDNRSVSSKKSGKREKISFVFHIKEINLNARFIRLVLMLNGQGNHFFLDEIEVLGEAKNEKAAIPQYRNQPSNPVLLVESVNRQMQIKDTVDELLTGIRQLEIGDTESDRQVIQELEQTSEPLQRPNTGLYSKTKLETEFHRLAILRSKIYKIIYKSDLACYPSNPMEIFRSEAFLSDGVTKTNNSVEMSLWQNEYESASINVLNCTENAMHLNVSVSPVSDQEGHILSVSPVTLRKSVFVYAATAGFIGDPLVCAKGGIDLEPGAAGQIWITWHSTTAKAGHYRFSLAIEPETLQGKLSLKTVPVNVTVADECFPEQPTLNTCNWSYTSVSYLTGSDMEEAIKDLQSHYTNVYPVNHNIMPWPKKVSGTGGIEIQGDFTRFDLTVRQHHYVRTFLIYLNLQRGLELRDSFGKNWMSESWKRAFSQWLKELIVHLKAAGVDYDRFALYPFDEQLGDDFYEIAQLVKQTDSRVKIYANSFGNGPGDFVKLRGYVDIWCFQVSHCDRHHNWLEMIKGFGKEIWLYEALAPAKSFSPYTYYRLMSWRAFELGLTGAGFWTYINHYKTPGWDDTGVPSGYYNAVYRQYNSPVDTSGEKIIPSRRWEAWREGIEDYQYLYELKKAIALNVSANPQEAKRAQQILDEQVDYVLQNPGNSNCVYQAREKITEALLHLMAESDKKPK